MRNDKLHFDLIKMKGRNKCITPTAYLLAFEADIVSILPHSILCWLLIKLGGW